MSLYNEKQKYLQNFEGVKSPESVCKGQPNKSSGQKKRVCKSSPKTSFTWVDRRTKRQYEAFERVHQTNLHMETK